ncbi:MAG: DUF2118 domain-containing protein [Desulfurococcales archaeon]|nr:DUF2118 domain-containing protein [Desulfurococcales archaeon]
MNLVTYEFPEVFVKGVKGDYFIVLFDKEYVIRDKVYEDKEFFGHILYENILNYIDLVNATIKEDIIIIPQFNPEKIMNALYIKHNTPLCIIEVKGVSPYVLISEGALVKENDKIAYVVTGKGEIRVYKSPCTGIVALVVNLPWEKPERYVIIVVDEKHVKRVRVRRAKTNNSKTCTT